MSNNYGKVGTAPPLVVSPVGKDYNLDMRAGFLYFSTIFFIVSCATPTKEILPPKTLEHLPPSLDFSGDMDRESLDLQLLGLATKHPDKTTKWWVNYRRARLWESDRPGVACPLYMELSQTRQFPLYQVAYLRAFAACEGADMRHLPQKQLKPEEFPEWMRTEALDIALAKARRNLDKKVHMELAVEKSKQFLPQPEKVEYTKEALALARELKDQENIKFLEARLNKLSPKHISRPTPQQYLEVAYDFRRYREFDQAHRYYNKVIKGSKFSYESKVKAYKGIRTTYKLERKKPEY
ncbi:MAG: hypothetical protein KDD43_12230, partial [Bdellovibrionales bacterium]|nr:hypothetical protein [Bdellovibrionales bacterium]